ncbi:MAG: DUF1566 domain-containing protein [Akkermansiaceae bacterium]|nr:DUF1566 domain-containing protein [Akkermansiaceae bacterium]
MKTYLTVLALVLTIGVQAHTTDADGVPLNKETLRQHIADEIRARRTALAKARSQPEPKPLLTEPLQLVAAQPTVTPPGNAALMQASFGAFQPGVRIYNDASYFYVESDSMPDATLMPNPMVGITAWQQQLPHPVGYFSNVTNPESSTSSLGYGQPNVWKIPLVPVPAVAPISLTGNFLRGAVALGANGIPIFNPRNNTGQFSQAIGELDAYGGHCGRADDYHYHIAPTHLYSVLTSDKPCAWALDGYPIYGYLEPDGSAQQALDVDGGHSHGTWGYHYHARGSVATGPQSPYLMNAMHGAVVNFGGQIDPQPTASTVSAAGAPLSGAVITSFTRPATDRWVMTYTVSGTTYTVTASVDRVAHTVTVSQQTPTDPTGAPATYSSASRFNYYPMAPWSMNKLPDTGQTTNATATFGEDSDYTINAPSFTDNGNGTITDNNTGLIWQKTDSGEMIWDTARTSAATLNLAGFTDWRLPTAQEAFSILDHERNPALNGTYFVNNASGTPGYFWTSDLFYGDNTKVWCTNTGGGIGPHPKISTISAGGTLRFHARYVRGSKPTTGHHYRNNNDGTITDLDTGLMWTQVPSSAQSWVNALTYAEGLTTAGYSNWRLPNVKELQSLQDIPRATSTVVTTNTCINRVLFPAATATAYWSSTSVKTGTPTQAWLVDFGVTTTSAPSRNQQGIVSYEPYTSTYPVFAVREAPAAVVTQISVKQPSDTLLTDGTSTVAYGSVNVGSTLSKTFTIFNNSTTSVLNISGATIDGTNGANFTVTAPPASVIAASGSTTMVIQFNASTAGSKTAALHIASSDTSVGAAFDINLTGTGIIPPPTITNTRTSPNTPTYVDDVWVTAQITTGSGATVTKAQMIYSDGTQTTSTVFAETMSNTATATGGWDGTGAVYPWTVTSTGGAGNIKQLAVANHGAGNICGVQFDKGTASATATMIHTPNAVNATGSEGKLQFWVGTANLTAGLGWNLQLATDATGTNWVTRDGESDGSNHPIQLRTYTLLPTERVNTLRMRFQFIGNNVGGSTGPKTYLDDISLVTTTGAPPVSVMMHDDGLHGDGLAGDGVYGAAIPVQTAGKVITYNLSVTDSNGSTTTSTIAGTYTVSAVTPVNFKATAIVSGGNVTITWPTQSGISYSVQWSPDLVQWLDIPVGQVGTWTDTTTSNVARRFYRVSR